MRTSGCHTSVTNRCTFASVSPISGTGETTNEPRSRVRGLNIYFGSDCKKHRGSRLISCPIGIPSSDMISQKALESTIKSVTLQMALPF